MGSNPDDIAENKDRLRSIEHWLIRPSEKVKPNALFLQQETNNLNELLSRKEWSQDYTRSLELQQIRATFHADQAREAAIRHYQSSGTKPNVAVMAETIACVHALHAMADSIAQIINAFVLEESERLSEDKVSFWPIMEKLKAQMPNSQLDDAVGKLKKSSKFEYIVAFCNKIKHRSLVNYGQGLTIDVSGIPAEHDVQFTNFEYDGKPCPRLWAREIFLDYRSEIFRLVAEVIKEVSALISDPQNPPE